MTAPEPTNAAAQVQLTCPKCAAALEFAADQAGTWARCSTCKAPVRVPGRGGTIQVNVAKPAAQALQELSPDNGDTPGAPPKRRTTFAFSDFGKPERPAGVVARTTSIVPAAPTPTQVQHDPVLEMARLSGIPLPPDLAAPAGLSEPGVFKPRTTGFKAAPPIPNSAQHAVPVAPDAASPAEPVAPPASDPKDPKAWRKELLANSYKEPAPLKPMDFITAAWSGRVIGGMAVVFLSMLGALFITMIGGMVLGMLAGPAGAPVTGLFLMTICMGIVLRYPFAICDAECSGAQEVGMHRWTILNTAKTVVLVNLIVWIPTVGMMYMHPVLGALVFYTLALLYTPMAYLVAIVHGAELAAFNPLLVINWIGRMFLPYLGIVGLLFVEWTALFILFGIALVLFGVLAFGMSVAGAERGSIMTLFGFFAVFSVVALHPLVYMYCMLGMLYRKHAKELVG